MATFEWPSFYNFPPFFTVQPNAETRERQVQVWGELVLGYCKHHKSFLLEVKDAAASELFFNTKINRRLSSEGIMLVLEHLASSGHVEWQAKDRSRCLVMWRSPQEWAALIYQWAVDSGNVDTVCTLYELHSGDATIGTEFYGLETVMLRKALGVLEQRGQAQVFTASSDDDAGVKFFSQK
eukprot:Colp12_sorted_trinity150504_noHs@21299